MVHNYKTWYIKVKALSHRVFRLNQPDITLLLNGPTLVSLKSRITLVVINNKWKIVVTSIYHLRTIICSNCSCPSAFGKAPTVSTSMLYFFIHSDSKYCTLKEKETIYWKPLSLVFFSWKYIQILAVSADTGTVPRSRWVFCTKCWDKLKHIIVCGCYIGTSTGT